jgi:hypothetical protein
MKCQFVISGAALTLFLTAASSATADTISQSVHFNVPGMPVSVPQFNPASGTLTSIELSFNGTAGGSVSVNNPTSVGTSFTLSLMAPAHASVLGSSLTGYAYGGGSWNGFAPANGGTGLFINSPYFGGGYSALASDLSFFTGTGFVSLQADGDPWTFSINPTSLQYQAMGFDSVVSDATLRYNYTPIPEPGALTLLIGGLALLGLRPKP